MYSHGFAPGLSAHPRQFTSLLK